MNKKGQALIEFILILPVLLLVLMAMIDIGNIFLKKYDLNNDMDIVSNLYQNGETKQLAAYLASEDLSFEDTAHDGTVTLSLKKTVTISAPVLSNIIGKNYEIETTKTIYENDEDLDGE